MAGKQIIDQGSESIVLKSPFRKTLHGFLTLAAATLVYYIWVGQQDASVLVRSALIVLTVLLVGMGLYRILTIDITMLRKGQKSFLRRTYYFGVIKRETAFTFDYLDLMPRDVYLGVWSVRAYLSEEHIASLTVTDNDRMRLERGCILIEGFSRKDAVAIREQLEQYSGVERRPKPKDRKF